MITLAPCSLRPVLLALTLCRLAALVATGCAVQPASAAPPGDGRCVAGAGPFVTVRVQGLRDDKGRLKLELYPANDADFLRNDDDLLRENKAFRRAWAPVPETSNSVLCIAAPSAGRYALLFVHSRNGRNKFDIWSDGAGVTGSRRLGRSKPNVAEATIDVPPQGLTVTIVAQYLNGLGGFSAGHH